MFMMISFIQKSSWINKHSVPVRHLKNCQLPINTSCVFGRHGNEWKVPLAHEHHRDKCDVNVIDYCYYSSPTGCRIAQLRRGHPLSVAVQVLHTQVNVTVWQEWGTDGWSYRSWSTDQRGERERAQLVSGSTVELVLKLHPARDRSRINTRQSRTLPSRAHTDAKAGHSPHETTFKFTRSRCLLQHLAHKHLFPMSDMSHQDPWFILQTKRLQC